MQFSSIVGETGDYCCDNFHAGLLSWSNWNLESWCLWKEKIREYPEKNPRCKVRTNSKLNCILYLICSERKGGRRPRNFNKNWVCIGIQSTMFFIQQVAAESYLTAIWTTFTSWKMRLWKQYIFTLFTIILWWRHLAFHLFGVCCEYVTLPCSFNHYWNNMFLRIEC